MTWHDLLFLHWPVSAESLRNVVPSGLEIDTFQGRAYAALVPFRMSGVRLRWLPPIPGTHRFPELNVRTYVTCGGIPGVWFCSLDAASPLAVRVARAWFRLSYFRADMSMRTSDGWFEYASRRGMHDAELRCRYRPRGGVFRAEPGTLEHWMTERYCLFAADSRGRIFRGDIHHHPWPLQLADVEVEANTMTAAAGISLPQAPPLAHFAKRLDVVAWSPQRATTAFNAATTSVPAWPRPWRRGAGTA
jgi:uncharacterized protein